MRKAYVFLFLGIWTAVLPYLGFPYSWKDILTTITGIVFIYLSFIIYKESKSEQNKETEEMPDNFSENNFFSETETTIKKEDGAESQEN